MKHKIIILFLSFGFILSNAEASILEKSLKFQEASEVVKKFKGLYYNSYVDRTKAKTPYDNCEGNNKPFACCPRILSIDIEGYDNLNSELDEIYIVLKYEDVREQNSYKTIFKFILNETGKKETRVKNSNTETKIMYDSKWGTSGDLGRSEFHDEASLSLKDGKLAFSFARDDDETTCRYYKSN